MQYMYIYRERERGRDTYHIRTSWCLRRSWAGRVPGGCILWRCLLNVCVYLSLYIQIYVYVYICIYGYTFICYIIVYHMLSCVCVYIYLSISLSLYIHIYIYIYIYICIYVYVMIMVCLDLLVCVYLGYPGGCAGFVIRCRLNGYLA